MNRILIFLPILLVLSVESKCQDSTRYIGLKLGVNSSKITDHDKEYNVDDPLVPGFNGGIILLSPITKNLQFYTELVYSLRGDKYSYYTGFNRERTETNIKLNSIDLPLLFRIKPGNNKKFQFQFILGPGLTYFIGKTGIKTDKKLNSPDGFRKSIEKEIQNRVVGNFQIGLGFRIPLPQGFIISEARYSQTGAVLSKGAQTNTWTYAVIFPIVKF